MASGRSRLPLLLLVPALLLVAPASAGPRRARHDATPHPPDARSVEVLTLNAWGLPWPVARSQRWPRLQRLARYLDDAPFHVVGLQEVWSGALRAMGSLELLRPARREDSGLALVSRLDVAADVELRPFRAARGFDRLKSKGVLGTTVDAPGGARIRVLVTHLQSGRGVRNALVRRDQVTEILEVALASDAPVVLLGDLNFYARSEHDAATEALLRDAGFLDAAEHRGVLDPTHPREQQRFDRVYLRDGGGWTFTPTEVQVLRYGDGLPFLSDHLPVRARVEIARLGER